ncbi:MAG: type II toxin-antitoxin system VapC family toxin [Bifidobacteriaceae bacterium]|jgi:PIN domain nuclease of toxin-antitoxin system|nr:type II toxin-antitoxin system VapC family toxin [Bifidobacteriaceae bacterium]
MTTVLDASAVLAYLGGETGAEAVGQALADGAVCSAANWSEVAQKALASGRDWTAAGRLLASLGLKIEPVTRQDAEWAARRWRRGEGLSLADRLCLALAARLGAVALTADSAWGAGSGVSQLRP